MRTLILYNPSSGRGRARRVAEDARDLLTSQDLTAELFATAPEPPSAFLARLRGALTGCDLLAVTGGDGTLHYALPGVVGTGVPVYHLATGTENLFAREFGMGPDPARLLAAIRAGRVLEVDTGVLTIESQQQPFVLVCSMGPDANVIRRLDQARRGPISHLSYIWPIVSEVLSPAIPRLTVTVDGEPLATDTPGMVMVANSRQYAMRIDPADNASMTDGLLDVVFYPGATRFHAPVWVLLSRMRLHRRAGVLYRQGRAARVVAGHSPKPPAYQVDGECGRHTFPRGVALDFAVAPKALRVLTP